MTKLSSSFTSASRGQELENQPDAAVPAPAWQRVLDQMNVVPDEVFDRIPADSSEPLDHYIHGTLKRPAS